MAQRLDASGQVVSADLYDAYGLRLDPPDIDDADPYGWGAQWGYYRDQSLGLVLMTHRYYDPQTGRFVTRDPIGYEGGVNLYGYVQGNPVNWVDPFGLSRWPLGLDADGKPYHEPHGVSVDVNIRTVQQYVRMYNQPRLYFEEPAIYLDPSTWFFWQVFPGGSWDYKNNPGCHNGKTLVGKEGERLTKMDREPYGNFHYGATAAALGWSLEYALWGAGLAQVLWDTLNTGKHRVGNNGDDPRDQENIRRGYQYYLDHYTSPSSGGSW